MQVAIDNAKRRFDIDLTKEIKEIKQDMNIKENGYPSFWTVIRKGFNSSRVNSELICPMNYIFNIKPEKYRNPSSTLQMETFFMKYEMDEHRRKSKRVEELIQKYSFDLYNTYQKESCGIDMDDATDSFVLLRSDFDELIYDIRGIYISSNYLGLMSWLINRAFCIGSGTKRNEKVMQSKTDQNKSILLKVLYEVNPDALLKCFSKNILEKVDT